MMTDPYNERWLERLNTDGGPCAENRYLLVDGVFIPGLHRLFNAVLPPRQAPTLLFEELPGCTEETRDVSPFLVPCDPSNPHLHRILGKCSGFPMLSVIETTENQADITARLAAWCVVAVDDQRFNFRFPDTRRLPVIFQTLKLAQQVQFAGPASRWSYIDRNGDWGELAVPRTPSPIEGRPELDEQQFARLVSASEVDEAISILAYRATMPPSLNSRLHADLSVALRVAKDLDWTSKLNWCESFLRDKQSQDESSVISQFARWTAQSTLAEQESL
jgi:hypothetical protein